MRSNRYILIAVLIFLWLFLSRYGSVFGQDYSNKSVQELLPLAEKGDAKAQYRLGLTYSNDIDVPQDFQEAAKWYRLAAEQGEEDAQSWLGYIYKDGLGVPKDFQEAAKWYRLAAEQGHAYAQYNLGVMYKDGEGVSQDYVLAHKWFNLAADQGLKPPAKGRDDLAKQMTPSQIQEAQRLTREFKPKKEKPKK